METLGAFPDGEWECFPRMFAIDHSPPFLGKSSFLLGEDDGNIGIQSMFCSTTESESGGNESMLYSFYAHNSNMQCQYISQESSYRSNCSDPNVLNHNYGYPSDVLANSASMGFCMMDENNPGSFVPFPLLTDIVMKENVISNEDVRSESFDQCQLQLKRKPHVTELEVHVQDQINSSRNQKKKPRASKDKKNHKSETESSGNKAEETNAGSNGQSSSSYTYTSEDDCASQQNSGRATSASKSPSALNFNGKTRASRGSATDPQSLYARKRRERINDRLRTLQNLVPNGTKVDISTMLEEAVHYVKFLQLQIKLLSSDDMWMYAPIAYNGLDMGLDLSRKVSPPQSA